VYTQPSNEYVAGLFGSYNLIPALNASPVYQFTGVKKGKDVFFRPEDVKLMEKAGCTLEATVENIAFMGAYDEITLRSGDFSFTARAMQHDTTTGDTVHVSFDPKKFWYW